MKVGVEEKDMRTSIKLDVSLNIVAFIIATGIGYLEAGIRGVAAGAAGAGLAILLSWLGFLPVIGQILYILLWDKVSSWIHSLVEIKYALVVPYYMGLAASIILSIIVIIVIVGVMID